MIPARVQTKAMLCFDLLQNASIIASRFEHR
jgi:hypothetical protein